jgi:hypothetical protein
MKLYKNPFNAVKIIIPTVNNYLMFYIDKNNIVEIQKGILLYSCHIVRKFLNIDTEHNTQQSQNVEARRR